MENDINELQQEPCSGKEYKELEVILTDKGFVFLVTTKTSWKESQDRVNLSFHGISG